MAEVAWVKIVVGVVMVAVVFWTVWEGPAEPNP